VGKRRGGPGRTGYCGLKKKRIEMWNRKGNPLRAVGSLGRKLASWEVALSFVQKMIGDIFAPEIKALRVKKGRRRKTTKKRTRGERGGKVSLLGKKTCHISMNFGEGLGYCLEPHKPDKTKKKLQAFNYRGRVS